MFNWDQVPGLARDVSVSGNQLWVITKNNDVRNPGNGYIYELKKGKNRFVQTLNNNLSGVKLSFSSLMNILWCLTSDGKIN